MRQIYTVYDFKTPNGYLPFIYSKDTLSDVFLTNLKGSEDYSYFTNSEKILTKDIDDSNLSDNNIYLIVIDIVWQDKDLSEILSPKLIDFINRSDNFLITYYNHEIPKLRTF